MYCWQPIWAIAGYGNTAWVEDYKGVPMLFAQRDGNALALACSVAVAQTFGGFCRILRRLAGLISE